METKQQFISITLSDGSVAVMGFITQGRGSDLPWGAVWTNEPGWWTREASDVNVFAEISRMDFGEGRQAAGYRRINPEDIPQDRTYRNALKDDGQKLDFDMAKAREIHKDRIRRARVMLFVENDIALRDADLEKDNAKLNKAKKKRDDLRDATEYAGIEAAQTIEELKAAVPPVLEGIELD